MLTREEREVAARAADVWPAGQYDEYDVDILDLTGSRPRRRHLY